MCLLIYKPANAIIPDRFLVNAEQNNPHGSGVAFAMGDKIIMEKDPKWGAEEMIKCLERYKGYPAIVHFRYATHGSQNHANTHPFLLNNEWVAAHNGIITIPTQEDESDTRAFLRQHVIPFLMQGWSLNQEDVLKLLSDEMGSYNKMTFLKKDGTIGIANEKSGHWKDGVWYSNAGYNSSYYCGMGSEWDDDDDNSWIAEHYKAKDAAATSSSRTTVAGLHVPNHNDSSSLTVLPEKSNNYQEKWHLMNTDSIVCDCCGDYVQGDFLFESTNNMYVCSRCRGFLPSSVNIPFIESKEAFIENDELSDAADADYEQMAEEEFDIQNV